MSGRVVGGSRATARLLVVALLALVLVGLTTWRLDRSMGQTTVRRLPERLWSIKPFVAEIPEALINRSAPLAPAGGFAPGETVGRIVIPRMSLDSPIVEMANCDDRENLDRGPGHIKGTALPGAAGNCAIAGHRSTYTRPFSQMGILEAGDEIILIEPSGARHLYRVSRVWVVSPQEISVLGPTPERCLTLITCHPAGSARSRLILRAVLSG